MLLENIVFTALLPGQAGSVSQGRTGEKKNRKYTAAGVGVPDGAEKNSYPCYPGRRALGLMGGPANIT